VWQNAYKGVTIGFGFTPDWIKSGASFLNQSGGVVSVKPITFRHLNQTTLCLIYNLKFIYLCEIYVKFFLDFCDIQM